MSTITVKDGTTIYYKDWGRGPTITFSHGWPLNSDAWDGQMLYLIEHGYRCVAVDRRGHGRSSQPSTGNDMDGFADDLAAVIEALNLKDATLIGHSTGGGEVARYVARHGSKRVAAVVLLSAVPPHHVENCDQSRRLADGGFRHHSRGGCWRSFAVLQGPRNTVLRRQSAWSKVSQGILDQFWLWSMQAGAVNAYESVKAFSETDFTEDLKKFDFPTLVLHGEDDQIVPVKDSAKKSAKLVKGAKEIYYPGAPHGLTATHQDRVNADLLAFVEDVRKRKAA